MIDLGTNNHTPGCRPAEGRVTAFDRAARLREKLEPTALERATVTPHRDGRRAIMPSDAR